MERGRSEEGGQLGELGHLSERVMPKTAPAQTRLVINHKDESSEADSPMGADARGRAPGTA